MMGHALLQTLVVASPMLGGASEGMAPGGSGATIGLTHYLIVSGLAFGLGLLVVITRRSAIAILMGIELLLNAAGLNFVALARYSTRGDAVDGQVVTLFIIVIAAAEAAVALALALNLFNRLNTVEVDEARSLRG